MNKQLANALPPSHQVDPQDGELVDNPRDGQKRLQDWAFVRGFASVKESIRLEGWISHCIYHHDQTGDYRKIKYCKRASTSSKATGKVNMNDLLIEL